MTPLERAYAKMTPEQRKRATEAISNQMGMPPKKKRTAAKKSSGSKKK